MRDARSGMFVLFLLASGFCFAGEPQTGSGPLLVPPICPQVIEMAPGFNNWENSIRFCRSPSLHQKIEGPARRPAGTIPFGAQAV